jgi:hypothetical protein
VGIALPLGVFALRTYLVGIWMKKSANATDIAADCLVNDDQSGRCRRSLMTKSQSHTRDRKHCAVAERPGESNSASSLRDTSGPFDEVDPAVFMLGMRKSRPKFLRWGTIAILFLGLPSLS